MSMVTGIILIHSFTETRVARVVGSDYVLGIKIRDWLSEQEKPDLVRLTKDMIGGEKMIEMEVYTGAFNFFPLIDFLDFVKSLDWVERYRLQVFVKEDRDDSFRMIAFW